MNEETYIQKQLKLLKEKERKNFRGMSQLLEDVESTMSDFEDENTNCKEIDEEYLMDIPILTSHIKDIEMLNRFAYYITSHTDMSEYSKLEMLNFIEEKYQLKINTHRFFFTFTYPKDFIEDLNYLLEINNYSEINHELIEQICTAYIEIQYYYYWCRKYDVTDKNFREKKYKLLRNREEIEIIANKKIDLVLPYYPQDVLLKFTDFCTNLIDEELIGSLMNLISDKKNKPKPSKYNEFKILDDEVENKIQSLYEKEGISLETLEKIVQIKKEYYGY